MRISDWSSDVCSSVLPIVARCLFGDAGRALAAVQLGHNLGRVDIHVCEQNVEVVKKVRRLADQLFTLTADRGDDGLHRLLAKLLRNALAPAREQAGGDRKSTRLNSSH